MAEDRAEIVIRYDSAAEPLRALKRMRRSGLRSPADHLVVEGVRLLMVILPMAMVFVDLIRLDHAIAAYCGYFALRWFDRYIKPALLKRFGPRFPAGDHASPLTMTFDSSGVRSETDNGLILLKWPSVPAPRVFRQGVVLRIAPEQSLVVAETHLPEGMSPVAFAEQIDAWRKGATA